MTTDRATGPYTGGNIVVLSGPSGAGKTSVARELPQRLDLLVSTSATTRRPRPGETDGIDYYFLDPAEFDRRVAEGRFVEWAEVFGQRYGTPVEEIDRAHRAGKPLLLEIDVQGGILIKKKYPGALAILLLPPDPQALRARLTKRGTEAPEEAERRFAKAQEEVRLARESGAYDVEVTNNRLDDAIAEVVSVIQTRRK
jgi:guanylate kinase